VPHTRLLRKLDHCGVRGNIHGWLESWLTTRERKVLVDGEKSRSVKVKSGVPIFSRVRVTRSLVLCVCFVDRCLSFCPFSFGHCVFCSSSIYGLFGIFNLFLSYNSILQLNVSLLLQSN
jgi:hypothetical protein